MDMDWLLNKNKENRLTVEAKRIKNADKKAPLRLAPREIVRGLIIGDENSATDPVIFEKYAITHILIPSRDGRVQHTGSRYQYKVATIETPLAECFNECLIWIEKVLGADKDNQLLVMAKEGVPMNAPVVICYLMYKFNLSLENAMKQVLLRRDNVQLKPDGCMKAMRELEKQYKSERGAWAGKGYLRAQHLRERSNKSAGEKGRVKIVKPGIPYSTQIGFNTKSKSPFEVAGAKPSPAQDDILKCLEDSPRIIQRKTLLPYANRYQTPDRQFLPALNLQSLLKKTEQSQFTKRSKSVSRSIDLSVLQLEAKREKQPYYPMNYIEAPNPQKGRMRHSFDNNVLNAYGATMNYFAAKEKGMQINNLLNMTQSSFGEKSSIMKKAGLNIQIEDFTKQRHAMKRSRVLRDTVDLQVKKKLWTSRNFTKDNSKGSKDLIYVTDHSKDQIQV